MPREDAIRVIIRLRRVDDALDVHVDDRGRKGEGAVDSPSANEIGSSSDLRGAEVPGVEDTVIKGVSFST